MKKLLQIVIFGFLFISSSSWLDIMKCFAQTVTNSGLAVTVTTGLTVTINGSYVNRTALAGTLDVQGTGVITLTGDWINNAANTAFSTNTGTVQFIGTAAQTIGGTNSTGFYNLTFNNTFGTIPQIIVGVNTTVKNTLTMTAGKVNLAGFTLTLGTAAGSPGSLSHAEAAANGWLYGGNFTRYVNTGTIADDNVSAGMFPMGTSANHKFFYVSSPAVAITTGGTITASFNYVAGVSIVSFADDLTIIKRNNSYWTSAQAGMAGGTFNLKIVGTGMGYATDVNHLRLCRAADVVGSPGVNGGTVGTPVVRRTGLTVANLSNNFYIGSVNATSPLPIDLIAFDAVLNDDKVDVSWTTASEINNDYFAVEKSLDGIAWEVVGLVEGAGNSSNRVEYSLIDTDPYIGISYYRLKQTDYNGDFSYSDVVAVDNIASGSFAVFPNPSNGEEINVIVNGVAESEIVIVIYDILGNIAYSKTIENTNSSGYFATVINAEDKLPAGVYNIMASGTTDKFIKRLVIRK